jgi:GNAT superfamily N-acetyltransferase
VPAPLQFTTVSRTEEVEQILCLQAANLPIVLTPDAMASQGFVTVEHEPAVLQRMNDVTPSIIAKDGETVVGYALIMPRAFASDVPILKPLFDVLDTLAWKGVPLADHPRWILMGQICVAEGYRGRGVFDGLYRTLAQTYRQSYDLTITEVAARNTRSLRAHTRVGFHTLHVYPDETTGELWHVIALELAGAVR